MPNQPSESANQLPESAKNKKLVAALFVEKNGCYADLPFVDLWDISRDARKYCNNLPVVAHPPCQLWGNLAYVNYSRWGGEHNRPGNDNYCFASAVSSVVTNGGVLEHPAYSKAFATYGLPIPKNVIGWQRAGLHEWVCEIWQSAYGHKARKKTWLFYSGFNPPFPLNNNRVMGTHQIGYYDSRGKNKNKPTLNKKEANATPILFRDELILLALNSNK